MSPRSAATASALVVVALAIAACGDDDASPKASSATPAGASTTPAVPAGAVALVGEQAVERAELERRARALRAARPGPAEQGDPRREVLSTLIERAILEEEARRRKLNVVAEEVAQRWRRLARSGQVDERLAGRGRDAALLELRLQLLREKIHAAVEGEQPRHPRYAVARFERELRHWRKATSCRDGYEAPECGP